MRAIAPYLLALALVSGCATSNGGSVSQIDRSDGSVLISYETHDPGVAPLSIKKANNIATRRCKTMGYNHTEKRVNGSNECEVAASAGACSLWRVEYKFQCAGNSIAPLEPKSTPAPNLAVASRP